MEVSAEFGRVEVSRVALKRSEKRRQPVFVQRDIDAVALASEGEDLLRRFCQLNDSLAALSDDALVSIGKPAIPEERDRAALIGAASRTAIGPQD